ncbi:MAG: glycosyltransferase [Saprospiraceae bacterium]|nr:glycosyltransferase [Saprospiraceae bacterium]
MALFALLVLAGIQILYWWYYFRRVSSLEIVNKKELTGFPKVSVVICFKGLPEDFEKNIVSVAEQDYPNFEIILVSDFSSPQDLGKMSDLIGGIKSKTPVRLINASKDIPGKKQAVYDGVLSAEGEYILFTDMDCRPVSSNWIKKMISVLTEKGESVVLGYGPMERGNNLISWFAGFETIMTALQYFGYHLADETYMSVGRNWMVKKSAYANNYMKMKGGHLASGDDDLMIQAMDDKENITFCLDPESFVYSKPKSDLSDFLQQKTRHISTSFYYPFITSLKLFLFSFSITGYYFLAVVFLFFGKISLTLIIMISILKWIIQTILHHKAFFKLDGMRHFFFYPLAEILLAIYYPVLGLYSVLIKKKSW